MPAESIRHNPLRHIPILGPIQPRLSRPWSHSSCQRALVNKISLLNYYSRVISSPYTSANGECFLRASESEGHPPFDGLDPPNTVSTPWAQH
jgi:hypothetical protein